MSIKNGAHETVRVNAYDFETRKFIAQYESIEKAARGLYIKSTQTICGYINGGKNTTFKGKRKGVTSYKTGIKYHFEKL